MSYCTVDDVKTYLDIDETDDDVLLASCIERAQAVIDRHTSRTFEATVDATKYLDAAEDVDGRTLHVGAAGDLCAITSVTNGDGSVLASTDYVTQPRNQTPYYAIRLLASSGHTWTYVTDPENAIKVVGKWAYSASAPPDIEQACLRLAVVFYRQKDTTAEIDRPLLAGDGTIVMPQTIPPDVRSLLKPYPRTL
jgi:hypothetical protein